MAEYAINIMGACHVKIMFHRTSTNGISFGIHPPFFLILMARICGMGGTSSSGECMGSTALLRRI